MVGGELVLRFFLEFLTSFTKGDLLLMSAPLHLGPPTTNSSSSWPPEPST